MMMSPPSRGTETAKRDEPSLSVYTESLRFEPPWWLPLGKDQISFTLFSASLFATLHSLQAEAPQPLEYAPAAQEEYQLASDRE
jgi:hypothetical protein